MFENISKAAAKFEELSEAIKHKLSNSAQEFLQKLDTTTLPILESGVNDIKSLVNSFSDKNNYDALKEKVNTLQRENISINTNEDLERRIIELYNFFIENFNALGEGVNQENQFIQSCKESLKKLLTEIYKEEIDKEFSENQQQEQNSLKKNEELRKKVAEIIAIYKINKQENIDKLLEPLGLIVDEKDKILKIFKIQSQALEISTSSNHNHDAQESLLSDKNLEKFKDIQLSILSYIEKQKDLQDGKEKGSAVLDKIKTAAEGISVVADTLNQEVPQISKAVVEACSGTPKVFSDLESELIEIVKICQINLLQTEDNTGEINNSIETEKKNQIIEKLKKFKIEISTLSLTQRCKQEIKQKIENYKKDLLALNSDIEALINVLRKDIIQKNQIKEQVEKVLKSSAEIKNKYHETIRKILEHTNETLRDAQNFFSNYNVESKYKIGFIIIFGCAISMFSAWRLPKIIKENGGIDIRDINSAIALGCLFIGMCCMAIATSKLAKSKTGKDELNYQSIFYAAIPLIFFSAAFAFCIARFFERSVVQIFPKFENEELLIWAGITSCLLCGIASFCLQSASWAKEKFKLLTNPSVQEVNSADNEVNGGRTN